MPYMKSVSFALRNSSARVSGHDREGARLGLGRFDGVERCFAESAVDAQARPRAHLDVHIRGALLDGKSQQSIEVQHAERGIDQSARLL